MVWLMTHIWVSLGLAAIFGLLFGWAFRGLHLKGRAREAFVQRDIALTELEQSRLEIDQLYAAQRTGIGAASEAGDEPLRVELEAREAKLQDLSKQLVDSQEELAALKLKALAAAGAGTVAAGVAGALALDGDDDTPGEAPQGEDRLDKGLNLSDASLEWRNRYLASRVRSLEVAGDRAAEAEQALEAFKADAEENQSQAIAAALAASAATATVATMAGQADDEPVDAVAAADEISAEKQAWQNTYLRRRLAFVEETAATSPAPPEPEPVVATEMADIAASEADAPDVDGQAEAEKAAWQTAYLAQRVSYLENHPPRDRASLANAEIGLIDDLPEEVPSADSVSADQGADQSHIVDQGKLEQELSRLRWRNRYLEGRLAYIAGDVPGEEADAVEANGVDLGEQAEDHPAQDVPERVAETDVSDQSDPTPAEAVLAALNATTHSAQTDEKDAGKPVGLDAPANGGDDLTRIAGVDEAAAGALNALGIWHFYQIADWSAENADWVDAYFQSEGRVEAEDWIAQAGSLSVGASIA